MSTSLEEIKLKYADVQGKINNIRQEQIIQERLRENYIKTLESLDVRKEEIEESIEILEKSLKLFQKVSDERNKSAKEALETVINWALSKIFTSQSYDLKIEEHADARSGKTMELYLVDSRTGNSRSLKLQLGTAMVQIVSFLMLLTVIKFAGSSKVLILDELFSGLEDKEAVLMFSEILTSLARNEGFQIIIVEQNSLISTNEEFVRVNVALEDPEEGLIIKKIDKL